MKRPTEDFAEETLAIDDTFGDDVRGGDRGGVHVLYMEVDKVADEVADMVVNMGVDKVADMLVKIPDED